MPGFGDWVARLLSGAGRAGEEAAAAPPFTARVYRGAPGPEQWPPTSQANDTFWASDSPAVADTYAANFGDLSGTDLPARVTPAEVRFQNPLVIDAGGREWDNIPFDGKRYTSDAFASLARRRGYDGLVLRNVQDDGPLATSYAAVKPGTVFSPLTGKRLYAGAPIAAGAAAGAAGLAGSPSQSEAATMPDNDQIVAMMLGQQPTVSGPLPQQAQPQLGPQDGQPQQPMTFDDHMNNIKAFWEKNRNALPTPPQTAMEKDPGMVTGELRNTYRPGEYLEPAEQGAADVMANTGLGLPAIPGMNALARWFTNPKVLATAAGAAGMLGMMPEAGTAGDSPMAQLQAQRDALFKQQQDAYARREAQRGSGQGKHYNEADAEYRGLTQRLNKLDQQMDDWRNSPQGQQDARNKAERLRLEAQDKEARTPFRQRHQAIADALPFVGYGASMILPGAVGAKNALGTFFKGSYPGRVKTAIEAFDAAEDNPQARDIQRVVLQNLVDEQPKNALAKGLSKIAPKIGYGAAGGMLAAEAGAAPDAIDAFGSMPEGPEKDAARKRFLDLESQGTRLGVGAATGGSAYTFGSALPGRKPMLAEARGRINPLGVGAHGPEAAATSEFEWGPEHPNYRPRGDDGWFRSR